MNEKREKPINSDLFKIQQQQMKNSELIELVEKAISKMCKTGGRSFTMSVPVRVEDTDMILSGMVKRFKDLENKVEELKEDLANEKAVSYNESTAKNEALEKVKDLEKLRELLKREDARLLNDLEEEIQPKLLKQ